MTVIVNGYSHIVTKESKEKMTIVECTSDIPCNNGRGYQNMRLFLSGHNVYNIGEAYECELQSYMSGSELRTRVVNLINN